MTTDSALDAQAQVDVMRQLLSEVMDAGDTDYWLGTDLRERIQAVLRGEPGNDD